MCGFKTEKPPEVERALPALLQRVEGIQSVSSLPSMDMGRAFGSPYQDRGISQAEDPPLVISKTREVALKAAIKNRYFSLLVFG